MVGSKIATAYVQVMPSMDGVASKVKQAFGAAGNESGSTFGGNLVSTIKGAIATAGIGKALTDSIMSGANLEQSLGGIETLFKDSADTVIKNAEKAYKTAGMSANQYMETVTSFSASLLQGLGGDTVKAASVSDMALTDMSDNANKMGTSMEMIQNAYQGFAKQNYTMLDNLKLGYGGTKTEMQRLLADAQKLTAVTYDLNNLADVYEAIHVIQEEMGITGTTAKEASETLSGSFASMKAAYSDFISNLALGRDLEGPLEALTETAFTFLVGNLLPAVGNVLSGLPTVFSTAFSTAIRGLNIAAQNADVILKQGVDLVIGIGKSIITAVPYLAEAAFNIVAAIGNAIISTDWIQIGIDTISDLRSSLDLAAGEILGTDGNIIQSIITAVLSGTPSILESGINIVLELARCLISNAPAVLSAAANILVQTVATIGSHLPEFLASGISLIGQLVAGLISMIPDVVAAVPKIISSIITPFGQWNWGEIGLNIIKGIAKGITSATGVIWDAAKNAAKAALDAAKEFLGIHSPARRFRNEVGRQIPPGMALGVEDNTKPLTDAMHDLTDVTVGAATPDMFAQAANPQHLAVGAKGGVPVMNGNGEDEPEDTTGGANGDIGAVLALLSEILDAIYSIDTSDERYARAVNAANRKLAVAKGGL